MNADPTGSTSLVIDIHKRTFHRHLICPWNFIDIIDIFYEPLLYRKLTQSEATILARPGVFEPGHTLVHLALRFQRWKLLYI